MRNLSLLLLIFVSLTAQAELNLEPGLWETSMVLGKGNPGVPVMQNCISPEMAKNAENFVQKQTGCDTKYLTKTDTQVKVQFKCKDGTKGISLWSLKDRKAYAGSVDVTDPKGKATHVTYDGKFISKDCGSVKAMPKAK